MSTTSTTSTRTNPYRGQGNRTAMCTSTGGCAIGTRTIPTCTTGTATRRGTLAAFRIEGEASGRSENPGHQRESAQRLLQYRRAADLCGDAARGDDDDLCAHRRHSAL